MILISAGHYPGRPGACFGSFCEHDEAMQWAIHISNHIALEGHSVALVPAGVLREKVNFIKSKNALLAVEIHFNSFKVWEDANKDGIIQDDELHHAGNGCETLYFPGSEKGAILADNIQNALADIFPPNRGIKEGWYRMNKDNGPDYFLDKTRPCPSVIVEPDFIHRKIRIQENRAIACAAIGDAIIKSKGEIYG